MSIWQYPIPLPSKIILSLTTTKHNSDILAMNDFILTGRVFFSNEQITKVSYPLRTKLFYIVQACCLNINTLYDDLKILCKILNIISISHDIEGQQISFKTP